MSNESGTSTDLADRDIEDEDSAISKLVDWKNPPTLKDMKSDLESAQPAHLLQVMKIDNWLNVLHGTQTINAKKGRSKLVPKLVRKQAEWRYAALSEPFLSTDDLFNTSPATFEDKETAEQNGQVLNYQVNSRIDKVAFIDEYIRTAVDEGTVIVRVGWERSVDERKVYKPIMELQPVMGPDGQPQADPQTGQMAMQEVKVGEEEVIEEIVTKNQPTLDVMDYNNIVIDPTCNGNLDKAEFIIVSFDTSLAELKKDGRYKNLDNLNIESSSVLNESDHKLADDSNFTFKDNPRKKIVAREYWGFWDIDGPANSEDDPESTEMGELKPFVATWVGDTLIRMEENPYPDKKLPFVLVQYLPKRRSIYGEPDAELLEDNQKIIGAVTRGIIDVIGRSANGQQGIRKDALDVTNARKFERGDDFKFNANVDPKQAFHTEVYPEIPRSAIEVLGMQNNEAEALTGVKAFSNGISGQALGTTATGIRSALDATSKRELGILRRLSNGVNKIGRKIISMNAEFLEEKEIIRITNDELVTIDRNDLGGGYDVKLNISTAEADEQKASELSFMLQTMGNNMDPALSQIILGDIAKLRKMPALAKQIQEYRPEPDPMAIKRQEMEMALLEAQIYNEQAKGRENAVDVELKKAKTATEQGKARSLHSDADNKDLDFVEKESGVANAREQEANSTKHAQNMEAKEHDRLSNLDKAAFDALNKSTSNSQ